MCLSEKDLMSRDTASRYTSKIIKAGALIPDTKVLFANWELGISVKDNLDRIRRQNLLGKASRSRAEDVIAIFRQRYLQDPEVAPAIATLTKKEINGLTLDRILYFHSAKVDSLLFDVVVRVLMPKWTHGVLAVDTVELEKIICNWMEHGKTTSRWNDNTIKRVAQGLLATLRDFGILEGAVKKRIAPGYLSVQAFAYIAFYLRRLQPSGSKLVDSEDWALFFMSRENVERYLVEAHQSALLEYHVAGSVSRLTFPAQSLEEYCNVLAS